MQMQRSSMRSATLRYAVSMVFLLLAAETGHAAPITLTPSMDIWTTSVYSYAPGGGGPGGGLNDNQLKVGGWGDQYRSLLQFNLSGAPTTATSATLRLYDMSGGGTPVSMYLDRVTSSWDWTTQPITPLSPDNQRLWWVNRPSFAQLSTSPLAAPSPGSYYDINITNLYNQWQSATVPNYGIQLRPTGTNNQFNFFASSENATAAWRPTLIVDATPPSSLFMAILKNSVVPAFDNKWLEFRSQYQLLSRYPDFFKNDPDFLKTGVGATFSPNLGFTLTQAANTLGFDHFNWLNLHGPADPQNGRLDYSRAEVDPPLNCYQAMADFTGNPCPNRDNRPWYLDEQFSIEGIRIYDNFGNRLSDGSTRLEKWTADTNTLLFSDSPNVDEAFVTCLAGIRPNGNGAVFNFPGLSFNDTCFEWKSSEAGGIFPIEEIGGPSRGVFDFVGFLSGQFTDEQQAAFSRLEIQVTDVRASIPEPSSFFLFCTALSILTTMMLLRHRGQVAVV